MSMTLHINAWGQQRAFSLRALLSTFNARNFGSAGLDRMLAMSFTTVLAAACARACAGARGLRGVLWPSEDIRSFIRRLCTSQYYYWHPIPPLLHPPPKVCWNQYCAIYGFPPPPLCCHSTYNICDGDIV